MSSTSVKIVAPDTATAQKVLDAFNQDPSKFVQNIASNPTSLGLSGDTFSYSVTVDGQSSSGQVAANTARPATVIQAGGIDIPIDTQTQQQATSALNGFNAQPVTNTNATTAQTTSTSTATNSNAASGSALYPSGAPTVADVNQGQINDCALDAQLASLAQNNPSAITNMIANDPAGGYDVTLYPNGRKTSVHVDQSDIDAIKGTTGSNGKSDWASVIEAATVKAGQSYASGSDPGVIMGLLTGTRGSDESTKSLNGSTSAIQSALSQGKLISASASASSSGVVAGHAYSVLSATNDTVTVRNPWGDDVANDGVETMSTADFLAKFDGVQMQQ